MSQKNQADLAYASMMSSVVGKVGCLNIFLIGIALGAGMLIDRTVGTDGVFAAILILSSVPVALWLTMRISLQAIQKAQEQTERQAELKKLEESDKEIAEES